METAWWNGSKPSPCVVDSNRNCSSTSLLEWMKTRWPWVAFFIIAGSSKRHNSTWKSADYYSNRHYTCWKWLVVSMTAVLPPAAQKWLQDRTTHICGRTQCILHLFPSRSSFSFILDPRMQLHSKLLYLDGTNVFWELLLQYRVTDPSPAHATETECFPKTLWTSWWSPLSDCSEYTRMCITTT